MKGSILILGGNGFIGSHLINRCNKLGYKCVSISLKNTILDNLTNVKHINVDIRNFSELNKALKGMKFDFVVNLSGYVNHSSIFNGGIDTFNAHFGGLLNIIRAIDLDEVKKFIQIGSSDEYGNSESPQNEDSKEEAISTYSLAKISCTNLLQMLNKTEGLPVVIFRLFLVYGEGQKSDRFLPFVINSCLRKEKFPISKGEQIRDFCYGDDIIDGILLAFTDQNPNANIINLASGIPISIKEVTEKIVNIIGYGNPQYGEIQYRPQENMELYADITKAKRILNWKPKVKLEDGLEKQLIIIAKNYFDLSKSFSIYHHKLF